MLGLVQAGGGGKGANALVAFFRSSIGKKIFVGGTGLLLCGFLVAHLAGNLLILAGNGKAFNAYAQALITNPLFYPAEVALAALFLAHIAMAIVITRENRKARGATPYAYQASQGGRTFASSTMIYTGMLTLAFLVMHIFNFRLGDKGQVALDGSGGLHALVVSHFQNPLNALLYVAAMGLIGVHVSHGLQSAFRTLGLVHPRYTPYVVRLSQAFGAVIAIGFSLIVVWALVSGPVEAGGPHS